MEHIPLGLNLALKSGHPILEFTNTVHNHASQHPTETLFRYEDLLGWAKSVGIVRSEQTQTLTRKAASQPEEAAAVLATCLRLRESIYRIFMAKTEGKSPSGKDLGVLNSIVSRLTNGAQVVQQGDKFEWQWNLEKDSLDAPLRLIALSAVDLMTSENYKWVGQCADEDGCGWLFVDTSKNHSRRWCDINDCGNRAKQRRYQKRAR